MRGRLAPLLALGSLALALALSASEPAARAGGDDPAAPSAPAPEEASAPVAPRGAPRVVSLADLPAISDDGRVVAAALRVSDGARGADNLALGLFDVRTGRTTDKVVIDDPDDPGKPGRAQREASAARLLARRLWVPLVRYALREDPTAPLRAGGVGAEFRNDLAEGEGLVVAYHEPVLAVREAAGRLLLRRREPSFSLPGGSHCKGCVDCPAPLANMSAVFGDRAHRVLFVIVGYHGGTDVCWEPDETFHVIRF